MIESLEQDDIRAVGVIVGYHGLKGEVKIKPLIDDLALFDTLAEIFIEKDDDYFTCEIEKNRIQKTNVVLKLKGYDDRTAVESLKGMIYADAEEIELDDDEYFITDLVDLTVETEDNKTIGKITQINSDGQHKLFIKASADLGCKNEIIVPFVDKYIVAVDIEAGKLVASDLDELIDLAR